MFRTFLASLALCCAVLVSTAHADTTYTVRWGDYLWKIAQAHGTTVSAIVRANGLKGYLIVPGQRLRIPETRQTGLPMPSGATTERDPPPTKPKRPTNPREHPRMKATRHELEVLARIVKGEAGMHGMPQKGRVAVAAVVLNRVRSRNHPNSIVAVAHQPYQFSCYNPRHRNQLYWGPIPAYCWQAARTALSGQDPTSGSTFYFNPYVVTPSWAKKMEFVIRIGPTRGTTHDFYRPFYERRPTGGIVGKLTD